MLRVSLGQNFAIFEHCINDLVVLDQLLWRADHELQHFMEVGFNCTLSTNQTDWTLAILLLLVELLL